MHDNDFLVGKLDSGVCPGQRFIIPLGDLAQIDSRQGLWREFECLRYARKIVSGHDSAKHCWEVKDFHFEGAEQLIVERHVGCPEIHRACAKLLNAAAGTNRLVIDLNRGMQLMIDVKPLGIDRVWERGSSNVNKGYVACLSLIRGIVTAGNHRQAYKN